MVAIISTLLSNVLSLIQSFYDGSWAIVRLLYAFQTVLILGISVFHHLNSRFLAGSHVLYAVLISSFAPAIQEYCTFRSLWRHVKRRVLSLFSFLSCYQRIADSSGATQGDEMIGMAEAV
jgi:hypothetical protein